MSFKNKIKVFQIKKKKVEEKIAIQSDSLMTMLCCNWREQESDPRMRTEVYKQMKSTETGNYADKAK